MRPDMEAIMLLAFVGAVLLFALAIALMIGDANS